MIIVEDDIYIRGISEEDKDILFRWRDDDNISYYLGRELPLSNINHTEWFHSMIHDKSKYKLVICVKENPVGLIGIKDIDQTHKHCEIGITIGEKNFQGKKIAKKSCAKIIEFLFKEWNMNVIYAKIFDYNEKSINLFKSLNFEYSGCYVDYIFTNGKYSNMLIYFLNRKAW